MLGQAASIWVLVAGVSYVVVGIYLLRKPSTVSGRPEFYLGLAFLFDAISYGLGDLPYVVDVGDFFEEFTYLGRISSAGCSLSIAMFAWRVFRPASRWARNLLWVIVASLVTGLSVSVFEGDFEGLAPLSSRGFWLDWLGGMAPFCWLSIESWMQFFTTRRRVSLGLLDPLVRNRYLLIAFYAALAVGIYFIYIPMYIIYELRGTWSAGLDLATAVAETVAVLALWVSFSTPAFYRRWVAAAGAAASEER